MKIICVERVLIGTADLAAARERWSRAGFALGPNDERAGEIAFVPMAAGSVEIDLCAASPGASGPLARAIRNGEERGGAMLGWVFGVADDGQPATESGGTIALPAGGGAIAQARTLSAQLPGVFTAAVAAATSIEVRRQNLARFGANANTISYLEHIVVMTPSLEDAIAVHEAIGVPCKRIREVGNGTRQAFFKLEQTVLEVVGPARGEPGCWGLAFMCADIGRAVALARAGGMQATEPKTAVQGGRIARIVDPLDGVAIAFMEPPPAPAA